MQLVDSHCHLQFPKLAAAQPAVIKRAAQVGVNKLICVGTTLSDSREALEIAARYDNVWASAGTHPHDAKDFKAGDTAELKRLLSEPKVAAVGEIGLDYFKAYTDIETQKRVLRQQIEVGLGSDLPYIFHVRDAQHQDKSGAGQAWDDFWSIFDSYESASRRLRGIVHSFSASQRQLEDILERGLYVGLNGIMTFTTDQEQLAAAKAVPLDKLVLETDAPFLAPKAYRGQLCEPRHVRDIAEFLAGLRSENPGTLADATTANAVKLFKLITTK